MFVPMYREKNMLRTMSLIVKSTFICVKIVIQKCISAMIENVLIKKFTRIQAQSMFGW